MKQLTIKRKEVSLFVNVLSSLKGLKDFKKAISLGRDVRVLKGIQEESENAIKGCKPENYDDLAKELQELKQKKAKSISLADDEIMNDQMLTSQVLLTWSKSALWNAANKNYNERAEAISNEVITIDIHTEKIEEKDFEKKPTDVAVAEVLSYFL